MVELDRLYSSTDFTVAGREQRRAVTFLPEPEPRPRTHPLISVDDHLIETPAVFAGRMPARLADRAPRLVETDGGGLVWDYDGYLVPNIGLNAVKGRPVSEYSFEPTRFEHMRPGAYDVHARVRDMDLNGVLASLNFPSSLAGFAGQRFQLTTRDTELARACVRAHNAWHLEEWCGAYPDRFIPCQLPWLLDPREAADEIRANAARGFRAVSFTEAPHKLGLPSLHTGHWDPFLAACAETGTVVNLHIGSSGTAPSTADDAPPDAVGVLFFAYAMFATVDWLFSLAPLRFPELRICLSEGGIGWVAGLMDRLDHMAGYREMYGTWPSTGPSPTEVLRRTFRFCALEDPTGVRTLDRIGAGNVLVEVDFPHVDSTWPDTQQVLARSLASLDPADAERVAWRNAAELYRHPVTEQTVAAFRAAAG